MTQAKAPSAPKSQRRSRLLRVAVGISILMLHLNNEPSLGIEGTAPRVEAISVGYGWPWAYKTVRDSIPAGPAEENFRASALVGDVAVCVAIVLGVPFAIEWLGRIIGRKLAS